MLHRNSLTLFTFLVLLSFSCSSPEQNGNPKLLGNGYGIVKATLLVRDLPAVRDYYNDTLGFQMPKPEKFDSLFNGGLETSIDFADFAELRFLSVSDTVNVESKYSTIQSFLKQHEGIRMYELSSSSADTTYNWLTVQGFITDSIRTYRASLKTPKGWDWDNGGPDHRSIEFDSLNPPAHLPLFTEQIDFEYQEVEKEWNSWYIYGRSFGKHPNGVVGIAALKIAVSNLDASRKEFRKMGFEEVEHDATSNIARFKIARNQELRLVAPLSGDDAISKFLASRGSGVYAIAFEVENPDTTAAFLNKRLPEAAITFDSLTKITTVLPDYAHGVQLEFIPEPEQQAIFAHQLMIGEALDSTATQHAARLYSKYCSLCHGENREGYAADNAPSLRSHSLLATSKSSNFMRYTIQYGRANTAMAGYLDSQGGPLEYIEIELILQWLYEAAGVKAPIEVSRDPVEGNIDLGKEVYIRNCAACHGTNGEGISAPALGNATLLATATDGFLKYAIQYGRDSTRMPAFKDSISESNINHVTAFLRSRASGWDKDQRDTVTIPAPEQYILNPDRSVPDLALRDNLYVSAKQVYKAMQDSTRLVLLDARSKVAWKQMHIPGSVPVPYYEEPDAFVKYLPNDSTWIVVYCACPHAASQRVVSTLKRQGFKKTAILDEGILVWGQLGYPVRNGH